MRQSARRGSRSVGDSGSGGRVMSWRARVGTAVATALLAAGGVTPAPAAAATATGGGVTLDLYGGLHAFGGASLTTAGAPYWANWDIARGVAVRSDGSGGWTLDAYGGIHQWGSAATLTPSFYAKGWDIARALDVLPDGSSGYTLDGFGGLHPFGGAPDPRSFRPEPAYWSGWDVARGLALATDAGGQVTGGWTMDAYGGVHPFGTTPSVGGGPAYYAGRGVWRQLHLAADGASLYAVGHWGVVGNAPSTDWTGYGDNGAWDATRDIVLFGSSGGTGQQPVSPSAQAYFDAATAPLGGITLDGYGGLHAFGGYPLNAPGAPYWPGWDIARAVAVTAGASGGWTLDGFGGVTAWGAAPAIASPHYWSGWDIARDLVVLPDNRSGYVLDGFGGLHAFGPDAPATFSPAPSFWQGWDIARGLAVATDGAGRAVGGWILDAWGGVHAFGSVPAVANPVLVHPNHGVWQKLHLSLDGSSLYGVGLYGVVASTGIRPVWSGYQDYGADNAIRDVVIANTVFGSGSQPASAAALNAFTVAASDGVLAKPGCGNTGLPTEAGKWIVISTECQELSAYFNGQLVEDALVTTGRPALPTQHGHTQVLRKNHPWLMVSTFPPGSPYYYYPSWVQYVTWIWPNGTGIHDASWEPDSALGPGSSFGPYASHGCIHVTLTMAQWIYDWADVGIPVDVI